MAEPKLEVKFSGRSWYVVSPAGQIGPYSRLEEIDRLGSDFVEKELKIDLQELKRAILKIDLTRFDTKPMTLLQSITLDDGTVLEPDLAGMYQGIHPAIEVKAGKAYIGIWIPTKITKTIKKKNGEEITKESTQNRLYLLTSQGELLYAEPRELMKAKLWLKFDPYQMGESYAAYKPLIGKIPSVEPDQVYARIQEQLERHMEFQDPRQSTLCAIWFIGTIFAAAQLFKSYPYLYVGGTKRVGKTKLLTLAFLICFNAVFSTSIKTAGIFRTIQNSRACLLVDETEKLHSAERNPEFRSVVLSGFMRGAKAHRVEDQEGKARYTGEFECFGPKVFANIQGIEDVMEDRCIPLILLRTLNSKIENTWPDLDDPLWFEIRRDLAAMFLTHWDASSTSYTSCTSLLEKEGITSREMLIWQPIMGIAKLLEDHGVPGVVEEMLSLAKDVKNIRLIEDITENTDLALIEVLRELVVKDEFYTLNAIKKMLVESVGEPREIRTKEGVAIEHDAPKWLNNEWIGRALNRLGFKEKRKRTGIKEYRLTPSSVKSVALRLVGGDLALLDKTATTGTSGTTGREASK